MKSKQAFTLIELLVVVLIIGILAAVALPKYEMAVEKARASEALTILKAIANANRVYYMANGTHPENIDDLDIEIPGTSTYTVAGTRKSSKHFQYGTHAWNDENNAVIAIAQRIPQSTFYSFNYYQVNDTICCFGYSAKGVQMCKTFSNGKTNATNTSNQYACYQIN